MKNVKNDFFLNILFKFKFLSSPLHSLPPAPKFDSFQENHLPSSITDSTNYYDIAIKEHIRIAQQQEFERLYINPPSISSSASNLATILIPPSLHERHRSAEVFVRKEENPIQGTLSPTSPDSSLYSVDLSGLTGSPGISLLSGSFGKKIIESLF